MKKTILLLAVSAAFFVGCTNENSENPIATGPIIIKGNILADIDEDDGANDAFLELVKDSELIVYVKDADSDVLLGQVAAATGVFEITVQVGEPRDLLIYVGDFTIDRNIPEGAGFDEKPHVYSDGEDDAVGISAAQRNVTYLRDIQLSPFNFEEVDFDN
jgi:hypothetical protein